MMGARFDSHHSISGQVGRGGGGGGDSAESATESYCRDQHPTGDEAGRGDPHAVQRGLQGMGNGGGDPPQGKYFHHLTRGGRLVCLRRD